MSPAEVSLFPLLLDNVVLEGLRLGGGKGCYHEVLGVSTRSCRLTLPGLSDFQGYWPSSGLLGLQLGLSTSAFSFL